MDRGAWQAIVPGVTRVGHDLVTKQQQQCYCFTIPLQGQKKNLHATPVLIVAFVHP